MKFALTVIAEEAAGFSLAEGQGQSGREGGKREQVCRVVTHLDEITRTRDKAGQAAQRLAAGGP